MVRRGLVFLLVGLLVLNFISALTGMLGNSQIVVNKDDPSVVEKTIAIYNVNNKPINVKLELSNETEEFVRILDSEFILNPDENRKARIEIKNSDIGKIGKIIVWFSPEKEEFPRSSLSVVVLVRGGADIDSIENESNEENNTSVDTEENTKIKHPPEAIILLVTTLILVIVLIILLKIYIKKKGFIEIE